LVASTETAVDRFTDPAHRPTARLSLARASREFLDRSEPGGDSQLLWATVFIQASREQADLEWVLGLLDGTTAVPGLAIDFDLRWSAVIALSANRPGGEELIARELERDPTDAGQRQAAAARAAQPHAQAKRSAWETVIHDATPSLATKRAIAGSFHQVDQQELLGEFVQPFFDSLLPVWRSHDSEEAISIVEWMYPRAVISRAVVDATDEALARDLPGPLRRSLLESQDGIKRALRAQAFDSAGTESPHGA
jgi:aminopeptidase N